MKKVLLFTVYILLSLSKLFAQTDCVNLDFEDGTFATWTGYTGMAGFPIVAVGFQADRHTIISQQGLDPITDNILFKRSPFGGNFSVRLGNENVGGEAESLSRQFQVTEESNSILLSYAVVFEDPGHDPTEQPKFRMEVLDANGLAINNPCFYYSVTATSNLPGFSTSNEGVLYRNWTPVAVDLTPYIGQTVTVKFTSEDCTLGGHFGYAYFDAKCGKLEVVAYDCSQDGIILSVPSGFIQYAWSTGANTSFIEVLNPQDGDEFSVVASTEAGCEVELFYTYSDSSISEAEAQITSGFCPGAASGFFQAPTGFSNYQWSNGTTEYQTFYNDLNVGDIVTVSLSGGPFCDTVLSFVVPEIDTEALQSNYISKTICAGTNELLLEAPSGFSTYQWQDNSSADTYTLTNPSLGDTVSLIAFEPGNCPQLYVYRIDFELDSNQASRIYIPICENQESVILTAQEGLIDLLWTESGSTSSTETIENPILNDTVRLQATDPYLQCPIFIDYVFQHLTPGLEDSLNITSNFCFWSDTLTLDGGDDFVTFNWTPNLGNDRFVSFTNPQVSDTIILHAINEYGCNFYRSFNFQPFPMPDSTLQTSAYCQTTQRINISAPPGYSPYSWKIDATISSDTTDSISIYLPFQGMPIEVMFFDSLGCLSYAHHVIANDSVPQIATKYQEIMPNAFSPYSQDGLNDQFVFPIEHYDSYSFKIYDRWGVLVDEQSGLQEVIRWNSNALNPKPPAGTYFYVLRIKGCNLNFTHEEKGLFYLSDD
jgi:gliding motility-associated-like protein